MKLFFTFLTLCIFLTSTINSEVSASSSSIVTESQKKQIYDFAEEFIECAGAYEAISQISKATVSKDAALVYHRVALGAETSAAWALPVYRFQHYF